MLDSVKYKQVITQEIDYPGFDLHGCSVYLRREDQRHVHISGNKWHKLKYNMIYALEAGYSSLLTFGGAYSNHIVATAVAAHQAGIPSIGVIRGEELYDLVDANPSLSLAKAYGMEFKFVSREVYREKDSPEFLEELRKAYPNTYIIPEGGNNALAVKGCKEILQEGDEVYQAIATAVGTGGTMTGIVKASWEHQKVVGFSVLSGCFQEEVLKKHTDKTNYLITDAYCFGGYAKIDTSLIDFINDFKQKTGVPLDPVYTGKMLFGLREQIQKGFFAENSKILAIHTGGLQGIAGMNLFLAKKKLPQIII